MKLKEIIDFLNPISVHINEENQILNVKSIDDCSFQENSLGWCSDKNRELLKNLKKGTVLISSTLERELSENNARNLFNRIVVENPRLSFAEVLRTFFVKQPVFGVIHSSSVIDESVQMNIDNVIIGPNVVIEENVKIGSNVIIGANSVIKAETIIFDNVKIGSNCTIGGVGFGYEPNEEGIYELIPHIGNVVLNDSVEIGNNVCIDRAVMGSTILEREVKVDNLVHIAHGVYIGSNSLIIAHAMIAGSVKIGKNTWVAPCAAIKQKVEIGNNALIGLGSVVLKNVGDNDIVAGVPAKKINN